MLLLQKKLKRMVSNEFLDILKNKKFDRGELDNFTHKFESKSSVCSDKNVLYLKVDENNIVVDISYDNLGCGVNSVVLEVVCDFLLNKNFYEIGKINVDFISSLIDFSSNKVHCVKLVENLFDLNK